MINDNEEIKFVTPITEDGPLYPPEPIPRRADLTSGGKANGELIILMGVISDHRGTPVSGAVVEIWQADNNGYYDHPRARGADAVDDYWKIERDNLDSNFSYFGSVETGNNGIYWFQTIIPRWYHVFGTDRAAHIHVKVWSNGHGVLTTELYFPGDEHESRRNVDKVFQGRRQQSDLIVNFSKYSDHMLEGVPQLDSAKYSRRDMSFL